MSSISVGEAVSRTLEAYGVDAMYGVISIHNLPLADAVGQRGNIRFVPARGEAGAVNMADAHSRTGNLAVALTSTGAGAGNAAGSLMEALNAGTPMLHITGQVEAEYVDRDAGFIHETREQLNFLRACSKAAYRVSTPEQMIPVLHKAIREAQTVPCGPVSIEVPVNIQAGTVRHFNAEPALPPAVPRVASAALDGLAEQLRQAKRPILWVGAGALGAEAAVRTLADAGIPVVSSTHARGLLPDSHPRSLRAFHSTPDVEALYAGCDLMLVVGSHLRSNETRSYSLELPRPLIQIDANPGADSRNYVSDQFLTGDAPSALAGLAERIAGKRQPDATFDQAIRAAVAASEEALRDQIGAYASLNDAVENTLQPGDLFVRDITVSGSTWGSRLLRSEAANRNIFSLAGAIGQGLSMAIGCAVAQPRQRVVALVGDGGLALGLGELATLAQENLNVTVLIMNDGGYGVMRGIQEKYFSDRQYFNELLTPDFGALAQAMGLRHWCVTATAQFDQVLAAAGERDGPAIVEVDMAAVGPLKFSGPPQKTLY